MGNTSLPACPRCGGRRVFAGVCTASNRAPATAFVPHGLRLFQFTLIRPRVPFMTAVHVCSQCGLLWSEVELEKLRRTIMTWGKPHLQEMLAPPDPKKLRPGADDLA